MVPEQRMPMRLAFASKVVFQTIENRRAEIADHLGPSILLGKKFGKSVGAGWPGIGQEGPIVGKPSIHSNSRCTEEPGEECQFLQVVSEAVGHGHWRDIRASQRITDL